MRSGASENTLKPVWKGALLCAPFLLFFAAIVLVSVWSYQTFIANSVYYDMFFSQNNNGPSQKPGGDVIVDKTTENSEGNGTSTTPPSSGNSNVTTEEEPPTYDSDYEASKPREPFPVVDYPETFPVITYGKQWATMSVEGWDRAVNIPMYFGDDDDLLKKGAGMSFKSSFPGQGGRTIVSAHVTREFYELEECKKGKLVTLNTVYGQYVYRIRNLFIFDYDNHKILFDHAKEDKNLLILYTCYPRKNGWQFKDKRLAVICEMVEGKDWSEAAGE